MTVSDYCAIVKIIQRPVTNSYGGVTKLLQLSFFPLSGRNIRGMLVFASRHYYYLE